MCISIILPPLTHTSALVGLKIYIKSNFIKFGSIYIYYYYFVGPSTISVPLSSSTVVAISQIIGAVAVHALDNEKPDKYEGSGQPITNYVKIFSI